MRAIPAPETPAASASPSGALHHGRVVPPPEPPRAEAPLPGRSEAPGLPPPPLSLLTAPAALAAVSPLDCDSAGAAGGVGSNGTQPMPLKYTSTHEWASRSRTR